MRDFLTLHRNGEAILVNSDQIETVHKGQIGSYVYFSGGDGALEVDEDLETISMRVRAACR